MNGVMEMNEILHASHNLITTLGESRRVMHAFDHAHPSEASPR